MTTTSPDIPDDPSEVISFKNNASIANTTGVYDVVTVDMAAVIDSWKTSLFSYEWIKKDGFKSLDELQPKERERRMEVEKKIANNEALDMPILGMGVLDNVEIGSCRATFLTLAILGAKRMPVHIPKAQADFFKKFEA